MGGLKKNFPALRASVSLAYEQALLFGQAKQASRERANEGPTRLTRPNRRACSQATVSSKNNPGFATEISKWILGHLWLRWRGISLVDYDKEND